MAFEQVVTDFGGMARTQSFRHAKALARGRDVVDLVCDDLEAVLLHVLGPLAAAPTLRTLIHFYLGRGLCHHGAGPRELGEQNCKNDAFHERSRCCQWRAV